MQQFSQRECSQTSRTEGQTDATENTCITLDATRNANISEFGSCQTMSESLVHALYHNL